MKLRDLFRDLSKGQTIEFVPRLVVVRNSNGDIKDVYMVCDGDELELTNLLSTSGGLESIPPTGHFKVTNLYVDATTGKLVVDYDNTPTP